TRGQRTFAHELGHLMNLDSRFPGSYHNNDTIVVPGWDSGGRLANNPAGNNVPLDGRLKPSSLYDIMNPGKLTNQAWIETIEYNALYNNATLATAPDARTASSNIVIQGIFDPTGGQLVKFRPIFRYPWPSIPPPPPPPEVAKQLRYVAVIKT